MQDIPLFEMPMTWATFSPDSHMIATNSKENIIKLVDTRTFSTMSTLYSPEYRSFGNYNKICWSGDAKHVIAGSANGGIFVWDAVTGREECILNGGHANSVSCVTWRPMSSQLATVDNSGRMVIWD